MTTSMNPVAVALFNKLTGSAALTALLSAGTASVFENEAPENADLPYVVFNAQSPSVPIQSYGGVKFENAVYQVKGITQGPSAAAAGTIADKIDVALADQALTISGYTHHYCRRMQNIDYPERGPAGIRYNHRGGLYRVIAS